MLQLYFSPMACSLASRIALMEAGIEARYHLAHLWNKKVAGRRQRFPRRVAEGRRAGAGAGERRAADRNRGGAAIYRRPASPKRGLAPRPGDPDRYRLQEWLSFVGTEIHKAFLFPTFWYKDDASQAKPRANASGRRSRCQQRISRTATTSSAIASPWRTPISPGRCCCSATAASISSNGHRWSPIATASRRARKSRPRSASRRRCSKP